MNFITWLSIKHCEREEVGQMKKVSFPYGHGCLNYEFAESELAGVLTSSIEEYVPELEGRELVRKALEAPVGSKRLCELAKGKKNVVIIASDHTRPVPSKIIIPQMLKEIRCGNPDADITILIATGCHRGTTKQELIAKFGEDISVCANNHPPMCGDVASSA